MDAAPPPVDVDMAPDDLASLAAPVTTDLAMEEDLAVGPAGDEDGQMAVSDDEEAGGHDELVMEDLAGEPPAPVVDGGEAAMQLEPSDEPKLAGVEDVSFEVEDADATPEVEVLSQPSPAAAAAASPALPVVGEATEVVELSDAPAVEDAVVDAVAEAASPATESFELVEAPSDAEEELEAAPATETATEGASLGLPPQTVANGARLTPVLPSCRCVGRGCRDHRRRQRRGRAAGEGAPRRRA